MSDLRTIRLYNGYVSNFGFLANYCFLLVVKTSPYDVMTVPKFSKYKLNMKDQHQLKLAILVT